MREQLNALRLPWDDGMRWRVALALAAAAITIRALVFVLFEQSYFDADQAVFGLMALHLSEARAFPLYMYGQGYMLAVSVWLAAPFVLLLGPTVAALKLPLLGLNLVAAGLLLRGLTRDSRLSPWLALLATLPFTLAPAIPASRLVEHQGGIIEPFVWILLLWVLRSRPLLLGMAAGLGYENREFTAYGLVALALVAVLEGRLRQPGWWRGLALTVASFAVVLLLVVALQPLSTYASDSAPQISFSGWGGPTARARAAAEAFLPALAGGPASARRFAIAATSPLGHRWAPGLLLTLSAAGLAGGLIGFRRTDRSRVVFPLFLAVTGAIALASYILVGRGGGNPMYIRYLLLVLLLPVGLLGWGLSVGPPALRRTLGLGILLWGTLSAVDHSRLIAEYLRAPPPSPVRELMSYLEGRGFDVGLADYWAAYPVNYLSGERLRIAAQGVTGSRVSGPSQRGAGERGGDRPIPWLPGRNAGRRMVRRASPRPVPSSRHYRSRGPLRAPRSAQSGLAAAGGEGFEPGPGLPGRRAGAVRASRAVRADVACPDRGRGRASPPPRPGDAGRRESAIASRWASVSFTPGTSGTRKMTGVPEASTRSRFSFRATPSTPVRSWCVSGAGRLVVEEDDVGQREQGREIVGAPGAAGVETGVDAPLLRRGEQRQGERGLGQGLPAGDGEAPAGTLVERPVALDDLHDLVDRRLLARRGPGRPWSQASTHFPQARQRSRRKT